MNQGCRYHLFTWPMLVSQCSGSHWTSIQKSAFSFRGVLFHPEQNSFAPCFPTKSPFSHSFSVPVAKYVFYKVFCNVWKHHSDLGWELPGTAAILVITWQCLAGLFCPRKFNLPFHVQSEEPGEGWAGEYQDLSSLWFKINLEL